MVVFLPDRPQSLQARVSVNLRKIHIEGDDAGVGLTQEIDGLSKVASWKGPAAQHVLASLINGDYHHGRPRVVFAAHLETSVQRLQFDVPHELEKGARVHGRTHINSHV